MSQEIFTKPKYDPYVTMRAEPKSTYAFVPATVVKADYLDEPKFAKKGVHFGSLEVIKI